MTTLSLDSPRSIDPGTDETYLKVLTSHSSSMRSLRLKRDDFSLRTLSALATTLEGLAAEPGPHRAHYTNLAHLMEDASHMLVGRLVGRDPEVQELVEESLQAHGQALVPLAPSGTFMGKPMSHLILLHIQETPHGHTLNVYNLGEGLQYAVPVAQRPHVMMQAALRYAETLVHDSLGIGTPQRKVPNALSIKAAPHAVTTEWLTVLFHLSRPINDPQETSPTLRQAIARVYDACKSVGQADYCEPQRQQAPQNGNNCMHKSGMAALGGMLPEPALRRLRAAHLWQHRNLAPQVTEDASLLQLLHDKSEKAVKQCRNPAGQQPRVAATTLPAVPQALAGPLARLMGSRDAETQAAMADCTVASVTELALLQAHRAGRVAAHAPEALRHFLAAAPGKIQTTWNDFTTESEDRMTVNHYLQRDEEMDLDEIMPRPVQYSYYAATTAASLALVGPPLHRQFNKIPFPWRLYALPTSRKSCAAYGAVLGILGVVAVHHVAFRIDERTRAPNILNVPLGLALTAVQARRRMAAWMRTQADAPKANSPEGAKAQVDITEL